MNAAQRIASIRESSPGTYTFLCLEEFTERLGFPGAVPVLRVPDNHVLATLPADLATKAQSGAEWIPSGKVQCRIVESQRVKILFVRAAEHGESWSFSLKLGDGRVPEFLQCCLGSDIFPLLLVGARTMVMQSWTFTRKQIEAALHAARESGPCSNDVFQHALKAWSVGGDPRRLIASLFDPTESNIIHRPVSSNAYSIFHRVLPLSPRLESAKAFGK